MIDSANLYHRTVILIITLNTFCFIKKGTITGFTDRPLLLSHPKFHENNFKYIINVLLDNGYPLSFIFNMINKRLLSRLPRINRKNVKDSISDKKNKDALHIEGIKFHFFTTPCHRHW